MPTARNKNKPGRPAAGQSLSPAEVVEKVIQLIKSDGIEAFTMRRLGRELGVEAMALYNHFRDKEAILDAVASLILSRIPLPPQKGSWRIRLKALCMGVRGAAQREPNLFRLAMTRPLPPKAGLPLVEAALSALADAGLSLDGQACAYHLCWLYVRGFCLWEIEEYLNKPDAVALASMAANYPLAAAAMKLIFSSGADRQFERGLDMLLRGISK